jgi:hypothetical protein
MCRITIQSTLDLKFISIGTQVVGQKIMFKKKTKHTLKPSDLWAQNFNEKTPYKIIIIMKNQNVSLTSTQHRTTKDNVV